MVFGQLPPAGGDAEEMAGVDLAAGGPGAGLGLMGQMAEAFDALHQRPEGAATAARADLGDRAHRAGRAGHQAHGPGHARPEGRRVAVSAIARAVSSGLDGLDAFSAHFKKEVLGHQDGLTRRMHGADLASYGALRIPVHWLSVVKL